MFVILMSRQNVKDIDEYLNSAIQYYVMYNIIDLFGAFESC